jgi:phospholipid-binding lipoprotein MlaA
MIPSAGGKLGRILVAILAATLSACASQGPNQNQFQSSPETSGSADALEKLNRSVFERNQQFNQVVLYPAAKILRDTVPEPVRDSFDAFTVNLNEPFVFANNILQLRFPAAATTLGRFLLNSTIGIGGIIDVASKEGLARQTGDFGQTLYVWGVRKSEFVVVPVVGPTYVRDAIGNGVELGAQMFLGTILPTSTAKGAQYVGAAGAVAAPISGLNKVGQMEELERSSLDFYAMMRSVVEQKRQGELRDALKESLLSGLPGFEDSSGDAPDAPLVSPALSSPALESPALESPALESPALESPALESPAPKSPPSPSPKTGAFLPAPPPAPAGGSKEPGTELSISGWTPVIEREPTTK